MHARLRRHRQLPGDRASVGSRSRWAGDSDRPDWRFPSAV